MSSIASDSYDGGDLEDYDCCLSDDDYDREEYEYDNEAYEYDGEGYDAYDPHEERRDYNNESDNEDYYEAQEESGGQQSYHNQHELKPSLWQQPLVPELYLNSGGGSMRRQTQRRRSIPTSHHVVMYPKLSMYDNGEEYDRWLRDMEAIFASQYFKEVEKVELALNTFLEKSLYINWKVMVRVERIRTWDAFKRKMSMYYPRLGHKDYNAQWVEKKKGKTRKATSSQATPSKPQLMVDVKGPPTPAKGILGAHPSSLEHERRKTERSKGVTGDNSRVEKGEDEWSHESGLSPKSKLDLENKMREKREGKTIIRSECTPCSTNSLSSSFSSSCDSYYAGIHGGRSMEPQSCSKLGKQGVEDLECELPGGGVDHDTSSALSDQGNHSSVSINPFFPEHDNSLPSERVCKISTLGCDFCESTVFTTSVECIGQSDHNCESLSEGFHKLPESVNNLFHEPLFSEGFVVDPICEPCYDTPPVFDRGKDELTDHPIFTFDNIFDIGDLVCHSEEDAEPSFDTTPLHSAEYEMLVFTNPLFEGVCNRGDELYQTRVECELEPLWCREFNSLDNPLFEASSELSDSASSPSLRCMGYDDEEAIIEAFLGSLCLEEGSLGVNKSVSKKGSGVVDVSPRVNYVDYSIPFVDHTLDSKHTMPLFLKSNNNLLGCWCVKRERRDDRNFDSLELHLLHPIDLFSCYHLECIPFLSQEPVVFLGNLESNIVIDAWLYHKSVFSTQLALILVELTYSCSRIFLLCLPLCAGTDGVISRTKSSQEGEDDVSRIHQDYVHDLEGLGRMLGSLKNQEGVKKSICTMAHAAYAWPCASKLCCPASDAKLHALSKTSLPNLEFYAFNFVLIVMGLI